MTSSLAGMTQREAAQALVGQQVTVLYLILPTLLTSIIAAYSIIGEKTARRLWAFYRARDKAAPGLIPI